MLLTVTPNLCIERTVLIKDFVVGQVHRVPPDKLRLNAGGKGINAARVAGKLGCATMATAWVGRRQHDWFRSQLAREGVPHELVEVEADTRVCINILSSVGASEAGSTPAVKTEVVEAGNPLQIGDGTRMLETVAKLLPRTSLLAICGSYPPVEPAMALDGAAVHKPAPFDMHLTVLLHLARRHGVPVLVDGKGLPFEMAVRSQYPPWGIKPNLDEAEQLLHRRIRSQTQEVRAVRDLLALGVRVVLLSCGARGAYLGTEQDIWFLASPRVREVSPVGSGDAMVGAFAATWLETGDLLKAMRYGVAAGAANAAQIYSAFCDRSDVETLLPTVQAQPILFSS